MEKATYAVIVYQEQVMRIASDLGGFTLAQADLLRRAMGKKIAEVMEAQRKAFVEGCQKNKITEKTANRIFDLMEHFAGYGFNKSHSAAYALISYRTAYLRAHHPVEFLAALFASEMGNTDKLVPYLEEAKRSGILILPPDVNASDATFTVADERTLRCGLGVIKNVGMAAIESIANARKERGRFPSIEALCADLDLRLVNRKVLESLIKAGACDSMGQSRAALLASLDQALEEAAARQRDRTRGQFTLFDAFGSSAPQTETTVEGESHAASQPGPNRARDWPESQKLAFEKALLGFYVSGHPLARHERLLRALATATSKQLMQLTEETAVTVAGMFTKIKLTVTKKTNEQMAVCLFEDLDGELEVLVFPKTFAQLSPQLRTSAIVFIEGRAGIREDRPRLIAQQIIPLEQGASRLAKALELVLPTPTIERDALEQLKKLLGKFPGPLPIFLTLHLPQEQPMRLKLAEEFKVDPHPELLDELERLLGEEGVHIRRQPMKPAPALSEWRRSASRSFSSEE